MHACRYVANIKEKVLYVLLVTRQIVCTMYSYYMKYVRDRHMYITKIMRGKFTSIVLDLTYFVSTKYGQPKYTNIYYQIGFIYLLIHSIEELKTNPKPT